MESLALPESLYESPHEIATGLSGGRGSAHKAPVSQELVIKWIHHLQIDHLRLCAIRNLATNREKFAGMAVLLWETVGAPYILLKELTGVYSLLSSPLLTLKISYQACHILALFQTIAANPATRSSFVRASLLCYVMPFINTQMTDKPHEYLRLNGLGVLGALAKSNDPQTISILIEENDLFPSCMLSMEIGCLMSKQVSTFILHKVLSHQDGLEICCILPERYWKLYDLLQLLLGELAASTDPSSLLVQSIIGCYHKLSKDRRACFSLKKRFPKELRDRTFARQLQQDELAAKYMHQLILNVENVDSFL